MNQIDPFDPTAKTSGSFKFKQGNGGWLVAINESPVGILFSWDNGNKSAICPAYFLRAIRVDSRINDVAWAMSYTLPTSQAPISIMVGETYDPAEWTLGEILVPLIRQVNQGNPQVVNSVTSLINDNNAPGTSIIEATPSDTISTWNDKNDASGFRKILSAGMLRTIWNFVRGNSGAGKATLQLGDSGDATLLTVYGSVQGGQPANVGALTSGAIASGAITANGKISTDNGLFGTDGNGNPTGHTFTAVPASASAYFSAAIGSTVTDQNAVLDIQDATAGAIHWQVGKQSHANGDNFRVIDNTHGVSCLEVLPNSAGVNRGGSPLAEMHSAGGGAAGRFIWVGTTDPAGSAGEGDLWIAV